MSDEADIAEEMEEFFRSNCLKYRAPVQKSTGFCFNCGEKTEGAYCDQGCREDHEKRTR